MSLKWKRIAFIIIGLSISVCSLWYIFSDTDPGELWTALKAPNYWWLLPNLFFVVFAMYQRAFRWKYMLAPIKKVTFPRLLAAT
ncbi:MAG: flippase-like domain-containing protein, partial [Candidatus Zixiibacteriota bacterium]